ncbi:probable leucine-rich repeat receptor-like serine/threonine-protein kinase At3g14840 [Prunus avium]|uniref:Probable leucine-rich repeat receptor-like serine/threonine-protein kinase At3g14840 n=1 Tax=Prunus avium TaxID=42229 RepID=A0A6P5T7W4_PRUAV|nr:probable leucine-rich repeat receptor-like serine/threonine-protein kinase At3g14840 [Prunus avium]
MFGDLQLYVFQSFPSCSRISSNNFTGRIPDYLENFKQLEELEIQASGLHGPIPSSISVLSNLTELRFSDLNGGGSKFPNLSNIRGMKDLYVLKLFYIFML